MVSSIQLSLNSTISRGVVRAYSLRIHLPEITVPRFCNPALQTYPALFNSFSTMLFGPWLRRVSSSNAMCGRQTSGTTRRLAVFMILPCFHYVSEAE